MKAASVTQSLNYLSSLDLFNYLALYTICLHYLHAHTQLHTFMHI